MYIEQAFCRSAVHFFEPFPEVRPQGPPVPDKSKQFMVPSAFSAHKNLIELVWERPLELAQFACHGSLL